MKTKTKCIEYLRDKGFTEDFTSAPEFRIHTSSNKTYKPHELKISSYFQCTAEESPEENSVVFGIETNDGKKGILVDHENEALGEKISEFIHVVNVARRKNKKYRFLHPVQWLFRFPFSKN
jgi:hypothetical protein